VLPGCSVCNFLLTFPHFLPVGDLPPPISFSFSPSPAPCKPLPLLSQRDFCWLELASPVRVSRFLPYLMPPILCPPSLLPSTMHGRPGMRDQLTLSRYELFHPPASPREWHIENSKFLSPLLFLSSGLSCFFVHLCGAFSPLPPKIPFWRSVFLSAKAAMASCFDAIVFPVSRNVRFPPLRLSGLNTPCHDVFQPPPRIPPAFAQQSRFPPPAACVSLPSIGMHLLSSSQTLSYSLNSLLLFRRPPVLHIAAFFRKGLALRIEALVASNFYFRPYIHGVAHADPLPFLPLFLCSLPFASDSFSPEGKVTSRRTPDALDRVKARSFGRATLPPPQFLFFPDPDFNF